MGFRIKEKIPCKIFSYCLSLVKEGHVKMLLYNYSPSDSHKSYYVRVHDGHGLGSLFARLFSKVVVKSAAKTALRVAKVAGKKGLKTALIQGTPLAKKAAKESIRQANSTVKDLVLQGIDSAEQKAINTVGQPEFIQSIANVIARGKTQAGARAATRKVNIGRDNLVAKHLPKPAVKKNKRKATNQHKHPKKKKRRKTIGKTLQELIEQV